MPMRVVAFAGRGGLLGALHPVALGRADDEVGEGHPLVDPAAVGAPEHALRGAGIADPALEVLGLDVFDPLPRRERRGQHTLQQRRLHPLPAARLLAHAERGADREGGEVARGHAHPGHARRTAGPDAVPRPSSRRAPRGRGTPGRPPARRASVPPGTPRLSHWWPGARRDERVVARAVGVRAVVAVRGDRAVHEPRVTRVQRVVVDAEARGRARGVALDEHVGVRASASRRSRSASLPNSVYPLRSTRPSPPPCWPSRRRRCRPGATAPPWAGCAAGAHHVEVVRAWCRQRADGCRHRVPRRDAPGAGRRPTRRRGP